METRKRTISTPREFVEYIRNAPATDLADIRPWERETLAPYFGYPDWPPYRGPAIDQPDVTGQHRFK